MARGVTQHHGQQDAIALLKSDHRQVEQWFVQFGKARSAQRKLDLAGRVCQALKAHTTIEEEIFYPAFLEATREKESHHEAELEHANAKRVIAEIEASDPDDDYYDSRMKVLSEMIKHHVNEEERRGGMFYEAARSSMDLEALAAQMSQRKQEVLQRAAAGVGGKAGRRQDTQRGQGGRSAGDRTADTHRHGPGAALR